MKITFRFKLDSNRLFVISQFNFKSLTVPLQNILSAVR